MKKTFLALLAVLHLGTSARAGLREPDMIIWGNVIINHIAITAADSDVIVEARRTINGPAIASYTMGSLPAAGNSYTVRLIVESGLPLSDPNAVVSGDALVLVVRNDGGVKDSRTITVEGRGSIVNLNFGELDSDGDGMTDPFETLYFGSATGGNPNADADGDGRPNLREFLQGTNPNVADGRHPADLNPADDQISLREVTDYILAWKSGGTWPIEPALNTPNIEDYVTRAGALWKGGEAYIFDNDPVTVAPLWWVNVPSAAPKKDPDQPEVAASGSESIVTRALAGNYRPNVAVVVTLAASPADATKAYAVVETPPEGWSVRNLSHEGRWDAANRKIKWGPFFDPTPRHLSYETVPPPDAVTFANFAGRGSFDGFGAASAGPLAIWPIGQTPVPTLSISAGANLQIRGEAGRRYELIHSTDLLEWKPSSLVTLDAQGHAQVPVSALTGERFFRLRSTE